FASSEQTIATKLATEIPKTTAHAHRFSYSAICGPQSTITWWLRSFPIIRLKPRKSDVDWQTMSPRDRFWRSKANLEVAKRNSPRDWLEDWGAASLLPVRPLQLFTNILVGVCRCIISIFFVWKIENRSRGSDLAIIFLGTAFRWSNGPIDFRSSFPSTRAGFCSR